MLKKTFTLFVVLMLLAAMTLCIGATEADTPKVIQPGDVNGDGSITSADAVLLAQYLAGWEVQLGGDSHTVVIDEAVVPTCKTTGLTEGKHCSDCGMILVKQEIIPTAAHDFTEKFVQPTTTTEGYTLCTCTVCGHEEKKDFIPAVDSVCLAVEVDTENKTCVITGIGTCADTDINIPEKISDYTVVGIADKAFADQTQITSVSIPSTVKSLGQRAFYGCTGLTEFTVPESVTYVGRQIFYKCDNLATVYYNSSFRPDKDKYFFNVPSIKTVVFGAIEKVPNYICYDSSVENVVIPDSVTSIGDEAFSGCSSLESVTIPDSVTSIGWSAFSGCSSLESVTILDSVTSIGRSAFSGCSSLESVTIPDSVTSIGDHAFYGCSSLESVTIPNSVTSIGSRAFEDCSSLASVTIPDSVMSIGISAFSGCSSLKSVTIPDSVTSIGRSAFSGCSSLNTVYYVGTASDWDSMSINNDYGYNEKLLNATRYYYSETQPAESGNYWRYVDGVPTPW